MLRPAHAELRRHIDCRREGPPEAPEGPRTASNDSSPPAPNSAQTAPGSERVGLLGRTCNEDVAGSTPVTDSEAKLLVRRAFSVVEVFAEEGSDPVCAPVLPPLTRSIRRAASQRVWSMRWP